MLEKFRKKLGKFGGSVNTDNAEPTPPRADSKRTFTAASWEGERGGPYAKQMSTIRVGSSGGAASVVSEKKVETEEEKRARLIAKAKDIISIAENNLKKDIEALRAVFNAPEQDANAIKKAALTLVDHVEKSLNVLEIVSDSPEVAVLKEIFSNIDSLAKRSEGIISILKLNKLKRVEHFTEEERTVLFGAVRTVLSEEARPEETKAAAVMMPDATPISIILQSENRLKQDIEELKSCFSTGDMDVIIKAAITLMYRTEKSYSGLCSIRSEELTAMGLTLCVQLLRLKMQRIMGFLGSYERHNKVKHFNEKGLRALFNAVADVLYGELSPEEKTIAREIICQSEEHLKQDISNLRTAFNASTKDVGAIMKAVTTLVDHAEKNQDGLCSIRTQLGLEAGGFAQRFSAVWPRVWRIKDNLGLYKQNEGAAPLTDEQRESLFETVRQILDAEPTVTITPGQAAATVGQFAVAPATPSSAPASSSVTPHGPALPSSTGGR